MKKIPLILILLLIALQGFSQQDPIYSLYMFNPLSVNPGYAGSREVLSAVLVHRSQWIGLEGAPTTQAFSMNMPLKNKKMGVGVQVFNDKIGPHTTQTIKGTYAYRLKLGGGKLAFGLSGGILNYNYDWNKIEYKDQNDAIPTYANESFIIPTFDFGIYYNTSTFYTGFSVEHINEAEFNLISIDSVNSQSKKYVTARATIGKAFILNDKLVLKTSALLRLSSGTGSLDINAGILIKNQLFFGLSLRRDAIIVLTEMSLTKKLKMGIAYDIGVSKLSQSTSGSFEIFVGYDLSLFKSKVVSPRYF